MNNGHLCALLKKVTAELKRRQDPKAEVHLPDPNPEQETGPGSQLCLDLQDASSAIQQALIANGCLP